MKLFWFGFLLTILNLATASYISLGIRILDKYIYEVLNSTENETECIKQLKILHADVKTFQKWAMQMIDSSAKWQPGTFTGNLRFVGNYDECLEVDTVRNDSSIKGQYCTAVLLPTEETRECIAQKFLEDKRMRWGKDVIDDAGLVGRAYWDFCYPAVCPAEEIQALWNFAQKQYDLHISFTFSDTNCMSVDKKNQYTVNEIVIITSLVVVVIVSTLSTIYDVCTSLKVISGRNNAIIAFSYYTNGKRLLSMPSAESDVSKLNCLRGIRVITMAWIILGHRFISNYIGTSINASEGFTWFTQESNMFILGAFAGVDSFFVISGCLIVYVSLLVQESGHGINFLKFYFHRIIRLTPALLAIVGVYAAVLPHLSTGPYWSVIQFFMVEPCQRNWWSTLLYVQNYFDPVFPCIIQGWYLSVDTQLYLVSPVVFLTIKRFPKFIIGCVVGLLIVSIYCTVDATYYHNIDKTSIGNEMIYHQSIYSPTQIRMAPWLVGLILGYILFVTRNKKIRISKRLNIFTWSACLALMVFNIYLYIYFLKYKFNIAQIASFFALSRIAWGLCVSWVIFACSRGHAKLVNSFLSLPIFGILSRLTYSTYLVHIFVIYVVESRRATPAFIDNPTQIYSFWGDYIYSSALAVFWTLTFESPITILEKQLLRKEMGSQNSFDLPQQPSKQAN